MSTRERRREDPIHEVTAQQKTVKPHDEINALRQQVGNLLNVAGKAIARARSSNSEDFLTATRQRGGQ